MLVKKVVSKLVITVILASLSGCSHVKSASEGTTKTTPNKEAKVTIPISSNEEMVETTEAIQKENTTEVVEKVEDNENFQYCVPPKVEYTYIENPKLYSMSESYDCIQNCVNEVADEYNYYNTTYDYNYYENQNDYYYEDPIQYYNDYNSDSYYEKLNPILGSVVGPSGKETYYNLDMSGCIYNMKSLGYSYEYWLRDDGVKMFGPYVMVAADYTIRPRGSIVETTLGEGIVCDTGTFSDTNQWQIDIATNW